MSSAQSTTAGQTSEAGNTPVRSAIPPTPDYPPIHPDYTTNIHPFTADYRYSSFTPDYQ